MRQCILRRSGAHHYAPAICFALAAISLAPAAFLYAQFRTPSIDGVIQPGEYGNTENGTNQIGTNTGQTWYMTWDASRLYVAIANANPSEGAVIYIDANPVNPPNGGTNANGNLAGFTYDGEEIATLPFRAQFVTYFKNGYNEYRNSDGNGDWTNPVSNYGAYASIGTRPRVCHPVAGHHRRRPCPRRSFSSAW